MVKEIKILNNTIETTSDYKSISELKFLKDNPRVYAYTHGEPDFLDKLEDEQQAIIYQKLLKEPSVKKLKAEIKRHGGLMEAILVRHDTKVVIEGNSRLAAYRKLSEENPDGDWDLIPCDIVSSLTDDEQFAYLSQIHVKGKTQWSAYEKANIAYVRRENGWQYKHIAEVFGETQATVRKRIEIIRMMKDNQDNKRPHFSYYQVIVSNPEIKKQVKSEDGLPNLLKAIKNFDGSEDKNEFTAKDLRDKLPVIINDEKIFDLFQEGRINLEDAYQRAKKSDLEDKVISAKELLEDISLSELCNLDQGSYNSFKDAVNKLNKEVNRINKMVKEPESKKYPANQKEYYTPKDLADYFNRDPKFIRRHMRKLGYRVGSGSRHLMNESEFNEMVKKLSKTIKP